MRFGKNLPRKFTVRNGNGKIYFERYLDGKTPRIKFNIPNAGVYAISSNTEIIKRVPIEISSLNVNLPPFERDRIKDFTIISNPKLYTTPARIFTNEGIIEKGAAFNSYPDPMKVFFLLHEVGHFFYKTEEYCDLFALVHFLQMGYNMSTAIYCLTKVLRKNKQNVDRVIFLYNHMVKNN